MTNENKWYGSRGIDTEYERELIKYRPILMYPDRKSAFPIREDVIIQINRSLDFSIGETIINYNRLIEKIEELLYEIKERNQTGEFSKYLSILNEGDMSQVFKEESLHSGYEGTLDYEIYTVLHFMKSSIEKRVEFIDENYRTQFTSRTEEEEILEDELESINDWIKIEYDLSEAYEEVYHGDEDNGEAQRKIEDLERKRKELDDFHTSLADISYVHKNRYEFFNSIINEASLLVRNPQQLIDGGVDIFIENLMSLNDLQKVSLHLLLQFKAFRKKHSALKQKYMIIDDQKEEFSSEKQHLYQKITLDANTEIKSWLYNQTEEASSTFDLFASIIIHSIEESKKVYHESLADLLSFYQIEADFYGRQIAMIQKKEEIRQFARIIEDLEEAGSIDSEWIEKYIEEKGYDRIGT